VGAVLGKKERFGSRETAVKAFSVSDLAQLRVAPDSRPLTPPVLVYSQSKLCVVVMIAQAGD
jgi:hypothetical protein